MVRSARALVWHDRKRVVLLMLHPPCLVRCFAKLWRFWCLFIFAVHRADVTIPNTLFLTLPRTQAFIHCQPSEPYLTKYLRQDKNISEADLDSKVWPADTYAALLFLLPFGLAAEHFGCIPVVIFGLLCRQATRVLLLWGEGVGMMVLMQVTYAAATGSNVRNSLAHLLL